MCFGSSERRKHVEETGSFGNSRRGRTKSKLATSVKREDPNIGFFERALSFDLANKENDDQLHPPSSSLSRSSSQPSVLPQPSSSVLVALDGNVSSTATSAAVHRQQDPTEVMLYGYKSSQQHSAIRRYESISRGYICEDYPRDPPVEFRRFRTVSSYTVPRALTPEEQTKVNEFAGGEHWIKVTFDSAQAADRATAESPQSINGYWVYAELYRGLPPHHDGMIAVQETDTDPSGLRRPRPNKNPSQTLSASFSTSSIPAAVARSREASTLPRSFATSISTRASESPSSLSSSTASSATVTGFAAPNNPALASYQGAESTQPPDNERCRIIPTARKIKLRPADEALLPTQTTAQWLTSFLPFASFFNGHLIGDQMPRRDDGQFDYGGASVYWRFWFWCDRIFRTDFCGLKDE